MRNQLQGLMQTLPAHIGYTNENFQKNQKNFEDFNILDRQAF